jgi:hypothetical protein
LLPECHSFSSFQQRFKERLERLVEESSLKLFRLRETSRTSLSALIAMGPIPIKLHFVDPVSGRKIPDREGHYWLDKRKDVCGHNSNGDAQKEQKGPG